MGVGAVSDALARLEARSAAIPDALGRLVSAGLPALGQLSLRERAVTVTGAGIAEGPARFLAQRLGPRARFVPASVFALSPREGDLLVVFSQALSPHARLALSPEHRFADTVLFTSAEPEAVARLTAPRLVTVRLEPEEPEDGLLLRVLGPAVARAAASLFADLALGEGKTPDDLAARTRAAWARGRALAAADAPPKGPVAFVGQGEDLAWARALAWKWMEGLWCPEPAVWDVLQFAHGPLQAIYEAPFTLVTLEPPGAAALFERWAETLDPARHRVLRSTSTLIGELAVFEHDLVVNALLLRALTATARELSAWPARDRDGPLYGLDEVGVAPRRR